MVFNSIPFIILVILSYLSVSILKDRKKQLFALLLASYIFYAYWDFRFLFLMIFEELICYCCAVRIKKKRNKRTLIVSIAALLSCLFFFKYLGMFGISVILPIGISFYTFQGISYIIDVWRGEIEAKDSFWEVSFFISFFPQLVAGPIMRAKDFLPQIDYGVRLNKQNLIEGIQIFVFGLFKKVVIADRLAVCVDSVFNAPKAYSGGSIIIAMISYSIQILCDFSGYSDMAVGTAKIFGFDLCRNFDLPYLSESPSEFWRRWHISLSQWLRDYLYIPLGGNRHGNTRTYINLFITMMLGGLWHGASWNFVLWGIIHGIALIIHRIWVNSKAKLKIVSVTGMKVYRFICFILCNCFITCSWVVFRLKTLDDIITVFSRAFLMKNGIKYYYTYTFVFLTGLIIYYVYYYKKCDRKGRYPVLDLTKFKNILFFFTLIWLIVLFGYSGNNVFIYFQF